MKRWFIVIVAAQLLFLVGESVYYQVRRESGIEVRLKVVPVDPRSLFMGNYMTLSYDISDVDVRYVRASMLDPKDLPSGRTVYVILDTTGPTAIVQGVSQFQPSVLKPGGVFLKSRVTRNRFARGGQSGGGTITVDYGISRYFIPEARQEEVNRMGRDNIVAIASVSPDGQAMLKGIEVNGKRLEY